MLAQYYRDTGIIRIFGFDEKAVFDIPKTDRKVWGFPPFSQWQRTAWGCEIKFHFEVVS